MADSSAEPVVDFALLDRLQSLPPSTTSIDLTRSSLVAIPDELLRFRGLRELYLEGNRLVQLPPDLFRALPDLTHLDLRNNRLISIPTAVIDHPSLKTILLQNNQLSSLPIELGSIRTLGTLSVSGNPLLYPPEDIVAKGTRALLAYLREKSVSVRALKHSAFITSPSVVRSPASSAKNIRPARPSAITKAVSIDNAAAAVATDLISHPIIALPRDPRKPSSAAHTASARPSSGRSAKPPPARPLDAVLVSRAVQLPLAAQVDADESFESAVSDGAADLTTAPAAPPAVHGPIRIPDRRVSNLLWVLWLHTHAGRRCLGERTGVWKRAGGERGIGRISLFIITVC